MKTSLRVLALASAIALTALGATACDKSGSETSTTTTTSSPADNTRVNTRDNPNANPGATPVTPMSQGNDVADIQTTANVRKALMADSTLSINGKNVKVVTTGGTLTLRGPVDSAAEKQNIDAKARSLAGTNTVVDQLDVTATTK